MRVVLVTVLSLTSISTGHATLVTLDTAQHPLNTLISPQLSKLTLQIEVLGIQSLTLSNIPISGTVPMDFNLNHLESGTIEADNSLGGSLVVTNASQSFGASVSLVMGVVQTIGVTGKLHLGPETVMAGNLSIDKFTSGGLTLDGGTLRFTFTGGVVYNATTSALGSAVLDVDLTSDPLDFPFSNLGTSSFVATTDDDNYGFADGAELNLPLDGLAFADWLSVTTRVTSSGNLYLGSNVILPGIPELNSFGLVSLAATGLAGAMAARRRMPQRQLEASH